MADAADIAVEAVATAFSWVDIAGTRCQAVWSPPDGGRTVNRNPLIYPTVIRKPARFSMWSAPEGGDPGPSGKVTLRDRFVPGDTIQIDPGGIEVTG